MGNLMAVSDLHITYDENRDITRDLRPESAQDWLIVAGDVAEKIADVRWALDLLASRFAQVVWTPGNHELWTTPNDPDQSRGVERYERLVSVCRELGVLTPEDPYATWEGEGRPVRIAPLFVGYDYTFHAPGAATKEKSLEIAHAAGIVCTDEYYLHPDPYETRDAWCRARAAETETRLAACDPSIPLVLANHYPTVREPTRILRYPEFAQWCGTDLTADWHTRFNTAAMIYGHLHVPRVTHHDGVRFQEVSLGYPREWKRHGNPHGILRKVFPASARV